MGTKCSSCQLQIPENQQNAIKTRCGHKTCLMCLCKEAKSTDDEEYKHRCRKCNIQTQLNYKDIGIKIKCSSCNQECAQSIKAGCGHRICRRCLRRQATIIDEYQSQHNCMRCKKMNYINSNEVGVKTFGIKLKYAQDFYQFDIQADSSTTSLQIKRAFIKKMKATGPRLKETQIMLRIIGGGIVFKDHLIWSKSLSPNLTKLQVRAHVEYPSTIGFDQNFSKIENQ